MDEKLKKTDLLSLQDKQLRLANFKTTLKEKQIDFEEENKVLIDGISKLQTEILSSKDILEITAMKEFVETNNKKLLGGLGIREYNILEYDENLAFNWALEHRMALQLNKKVFEKLIKISPVDFVNIGIDTKVTFPPIIKFSD